MTKIVEQTEILHRYRVQSAERSWGDKRKARTINNADSRVVTNLNTGVSTHGLSTAQRTGSPALACSVVDCGVLFAFRNAYRRVYELVECRFGRESR
jgi:hypothetical protein